VFVNGEKSFKIIDKYQCNRPITLDCQVSSNPVSNITWYKRGQKLTPKKTTTTTIRSTFAQMIKNQIAKLQHFKNGYNDNKYEFDDEIIGTGPTFTIASFNCGKVLEMSRKRLNLTFKKQDHSSNDNKFKPNELDDYEVEPFDAESEKMIINDDFNNDFGLYVCVASNTPITNDYSSKIEQSRRFIKLNPMGAPIIRLFSSNSEKEIHSSIHHHRESEVAADIGSSVQLTCLIDPLPEFNSVIWLRGNGQIIPNSKFQIVTEKRPTDESAKQHRLTIRTEQTKRPYDLNIEYIDSKTNLKVKHGNSSLSNGDRPAKKDEKKVDSIKSTLFIRNIKRDDLGIYKCQSTNSYGSRTSSILLREKGIIERLNLTSFMVSTLIITSLIVIFIIIIILLTCLLSKRARKYLCCCCCYCFGMLKPKNIINYKDKGNIYTF
jgi:hypothetical protein